ncbi:MAG TPA: hypothetical protein VJT71_17625 [Pyrinomonadaceae bacterium]|nr:hypothetical protein [Pyrinomonadaceae bacterium]
MYDNKQEETDRDCYEKPEPAPQPHPPGSVEKCKGNQLPITEPPTWKDPPLCLPDKDCGCPTDPGSDPNCLESLITAKAGELAEAEKTKAFKTDLESLLAKANAAGQDYTRTKYDELVKRWVEQDKQIAKLISEFLCGMKCWKCAIECYICPLLHKMNQAQQKLYWDPVVSYPHKAFKNLYDRLYWYTRDKEAKEQTFNRIKSVLTVWEKPAQTIEKVLADNAKIIGDIDKATNADESKVLFDLFFQLVPRHLAIAPPSGSPWKTKIDQKFVDLCKCEEPKPKATEEGDEQLEEKEDDKAAKHCKCDKGKPDNCCGPNVGYWTLLERFIGPQPYLIDPKDYITVICCLVSTRYEPAQKALAASEKKVLETEAWIKQAKDVIENGLKDFEKNAKAKLPSKIECCGEKIDKPEQQQTQTAS